jgi:hypothetical protein
MDVIARHEVPKQSHTINCYSEKQINILIAENIVRRQSHSFSSIQ